MKRYNERDIEGPAIIEFVQEHQISSMIDVGAHWSWSYYAEKVRPHVKNYVALDILEDPQTARIVNLYVKGNVLDHEGKYDLVSCISSIEHSGISTYKIKDYRQEQLKVFGKLLELSKKYVLLTFPYGLPAFVEGQFANIDKEQLDNFIKICGNANTFLKFYYSSAPQTMIPYEEVSKETADNVPYVSSLGTRCVCVMEITL